MISQLKGDIKPERWTEETSKHYPPGQNPWSEIYTQDVTVKIARTIGLEHPDSIDVLRLQLAATAEYLLSFFDFAGSPATPAQKHAWAERVAKLCHRLTSELGDSSDFLSPNVTRIEQSNSLRFVPASEMRRRVQEAESALTALLEAVQQVSGEPRERGVATAHAETMQLTVNGVTEVFIHFRGIEHVKRTASSGHIDGEYPEFVRASARPILWAYYSKFARAPERLENLNKQIQEAVSAYRA